MRVGGKGEMREARVEQFGCGREVWGAAVRAAHGRGCSAGAGRQGDLLWRRADLIGAPRLYITMQSTKINRFESPAFLVYR